MCRVVRGVNPPADSGPYSTSTAVLGLSTGDPAMSHFSGGGQMARGEIVFGFQG